MVWTVGKLMGFLANYDENALLIFQDRLGREIVEGGDLDVVIGVITRD